MPDSTRTTARTVALLGVLALSVGACGGNGDDEKASKAISDAIVKNQSGSGATSLVKVTRKQADCIGDGLVDKVGTEKLQTYKVLTKDLEPGVDVTAATMSAADAKSTTDVFFGCADVQALVKKAVDSSRSLTGSVKTCVDEALNESSLRAFLTSTFQGRTDEAQKKLTSSITTCAQSAG